MLGLRGAEEQAENGALLCTTWRLGGKDDGCAKTMSDNRRVLEWATTMGAMSEKRH